MNKGLIAILAGLTIVILLLANNNATVRDEKEEAKANIEDMEQEMQAMQNNQTVEQSQDKQEDKSEQFHTESKEAAINFINAYFEYEGSPNKNKVQQHVTDNMNDQLQFNSEGSAQSKVSNINVYFGNYAEGKQELLITFDNTITYNDVPNDVLSYIRLDMVENGTQWQVDNMQFNQYK